MNTKQLCIVLLGACVMVTGCRTTDQLTAVEPAPAQRVVVGTPDVPRLEVDAAYVAYVEHMARMRGLTVRWVNKPYKRIVDSETGATKE